MPRKSPSTADFTFVHERWEHSMRYWKDKGLTGESGSDDSIFEFLERYKGNQWSRQPDWGGLHPDDLITVNMTFANTNTLVAMLLHRNPEVIVTPKKSGSDQVANARRRKLVMEYFWKELKQRRQYRKVLFDASLLPFGVLRHGFTPMLDKRDAGGRLLDFYDQARGDVPWIRRLPPWDIRIDPDAMFEPDGDARWCAFRTLRTKREIEQTEGLIFRDDLKPMVSEDLQKLRERQNGRRGDRSPLFRNLYEIWEIYDKEDFSWKAISPGSKSFIREPRDWPQGRNGAPLWDKLPYDILMFNPQSADNVGIAFPSVYWDQQDERNKLRTMMSTLVKRLRHVLAANESWFGEGQNEKFANLQLFEVIFGNGSPSDAIKEYTLGGFDANLLAYDAMIAQDVREQIGLSKMSRAERINVETAEEASGVKAGEAVHVGRNQDTWEEFLADSQRTFGQALQHTLTEPVLIPIVGIQDASALVKRDPETGQTGGFVEVSPEEIRGEFHVNIRVGSTLPEDPNVEFIKATQLKAVLEKNPRWDQHELDRIAIESAGFDSARLELPPEVAQDAQRRVEASELVRGGGSNGSRQQSPNVNPNLVQGLRSAGGGGS